MILRKIIFIGETSNGVVYFNTKSKEILISEKSRFLNTEKSAITNKYIPAFVMLLLFSGGGIGFFSFVNGVYSLKHLYFIYFFWIAECIFLNIIIEKALYSKVNLAYTSNKSEFSKAANSNLFWKNFGGDKRITNGKKIWAWGITLFFTITGCYPIFVNSLIRNKLGQQIGQEFLGFSLAGLLTGVMILFIFQNNPIRFFKAVEEVRSNKYQKKMKKVEK